MIIRSVLVLGFLLAASKAAFASDANFVHLYAPTKEVRNKIANMVHIDSIIEDSVYSVVSDLDLAAIKMNIPELLVETHGIDFKQTKGADPTDLEFPKGDEAFHTYQEVVKELNQQANQYKDMVELFELGKTVEGQSIPGIKIGRKDHGDAFIPAIFFVGAHHAREHLSTEVPMHLINYLLSEYGKNPRVTQLLDSRILYFVPMLNVDGAMYDITGRKYKSWRKNRVKNSRTYGVDLNRNYAFGWGTGGSSRSESSDVYMGPNPFSEPETVAVKDFVETHPEIRVLLSFHTFSELILYPWGGKSEGIGGRDQAVFESMAQTMAKWNKYTPEQASDLYIASGDTCDWAYGEHNIFCFTFELSPKSMWNGGFYPGASSIEPTFRANIEPALYLIDKAGDPYSAITPTLF